MKRNDYTKNLRVIRKLKKIKTRKRDSILLSLFFFRHNIENIIEREKDVLCGLKWETKKRHQKKEKLIG